jgi:hypothetical protein
LSFLNKFAKVVRGVLHGFDRLFFRGSLRHLSYPRGLQHYLWANRIRYQDFDNHSRQITQRLEEASLRQARQRGREILYLNSAHHGKEDIARAIAERDRIRNGLICVLRSVDPCMSFRMHFNPRTRKLEPRYEERKCLHLYHYQIHPVFGFMHTRIQTWFPFRIYVCLNGREWLARQLDQVGLNYIRRKNAFTWLEDIAQAQALCHEQLQANWPSLLGELAEAVNPAHADIFANYPSEYYWSVAQSEWASDVMFRSRADLQAVYPRLLHYATTTFGAVDTLRFLGQPVPAHGQIPRHWRHEVSINVKERLEGTRIKHWVNGNSLKMYDKYSNLRTECMIAEPGDFKAYRPTEGDPQGPKRWRKMRQGIADLHRRVEVSQAANDRYLEALAAVHDLTPLHQLIAPLCRPALEPVRHKKSQAAPATEPTTTSSPQPSSPAIATVRGTARPRRVRALNPLAPTDAALLQAVSRHEFLVNGLRNRDLRRLLFGDAPVSATERRRQSASVTRQLRLLRGHGLIHKVPKTHRYMVSEPGRKVITALLAARNASTEKLTRWAG